MSKKSIPTEDDFERASAALKKRSRGLSDIRENIIARFKGGGFLHEFFILDCAESAFRVFVFYKFDIQIDEAEKAGISEQIKNAVFEELELAGRGSRGEIEVYFEFDSHEGVQRTCGGNYYNRLH